MSLSHKMVAMLTPASLLLLAACGSNASPGAAPTTMSPTTTAPSVASPTPTGTPTSLPPLKFQVKGTCTSAGGTLYGVGSGFIPGGPYLTEVRYPSGSPYLVPDAKGTASAQGTTPNWTWPCVYKGQADPPGTYKVTIVDLTTDRQVNTTFVIGKP